MICGQSPKNRPGEGPQGTHSNLRDLKIHMTVLMTQDKSARGDGCRTFVHPEGRLGKRYAIFVGFGFSTTDVSFRRSVIEWSHHSCLLSTAEASSYGLRVKH